MAENHLQYLIIDGLLFGTVNGIHFQMKAVSGGRAGSKTPGVVNTHIANNPWFVGHGHPENPEGGPIPCGEYTVHRHESKNNQLRLTPDPGTPMAGRAGFLIHGRGAVGSQGCIVPLVFMELVSLYNAVSATTSPVRLTVMAGEIRDIA
jgi:hypothetical protein